MASRAMFVSTVVAVEAIVQAKTTHRQRNNQKLRVSAMWSGNNTVFFQIARRKALHVWSSLSTTLFEGTRPLARRYLLDTGLRPGDLKDKTGIRGVCP